MRFVCPLFYTSLEMGLPAFIGILACMPLTFCSPKFGSFGWPHWGVFMLPNYSISRSRLHSSRPEREFLGELFVYSWAVHPTVDNKFTLMVLSSKTLTGRTSQIGETPLRFNGGPKAILFSIVAEAQRIVRFCFPCGLEFSPMKGSGAFKRTSFQSILAPSYP